ncbi:MAG: alpha/beta fold hydrolase [Oscillospiraceae bacterium]|nr:alpha/beta fold hydrolase [Oscillospiraceae bacterium]
MEQNNLPASSRGMLIPGKRGKILANCYLPGGPYPRPVVMICHGIPGIERLMDFAVSLREAGFCTVCFHYSGCFGSDGDYAVSHCFEDTQTVLDTILKNEQGDFDTDNIFLLGHSMGGLMTARTAALNDTVKAACIMAPIDFSIAARDALAGQPGRYKAIIDISSQWVHGLDWDSFTADARENLDKMDLLSYAAALADKPVLTMTAAADQLLPPAEHLNRLNAAIEACGKGKLTKVSFDCDHAFNSARAAARAAAADFFLSQIG